MLPEFALPRLGGVHRRRRSASPASPRVGGIYWTAGTGSWYAPKGAKLAFTPTIKRGDSAFLLD